MHHRHPLENPSLAPYGFTAPASAKRLDYMVDDPHYVNCEKLLARQWDGWNRLHTKRPRPVETIIHEILPGVAAANRLREIDFEFQGRSYLSRDILLLSTAVQWFGTSVGNGFLEGRYYLREGERQPHPERMFSAKLAREMERFDLVAFYLHEHNAHCPGRNPFSRGCYYDASMVTPRDRAVVTGLMRWLGRSEGCAFVAEYKARRERVQAARREEVIRARKRA